MKSTLQWQGDDLVYTTPKKVRIVAKWSLPLPGYSAHLKTFWNNMTYFVGSGTSSLWDDHPRSEAYWSTVGGTTVLVQYVAKDGRTAVRTEGGVVLYCTRDLK